MTGRTASEALSDYASLVQRPVSCLTPAVLTIYPDPELPAHYRVVPGNGDPLPLDSEGGPLSLYVRQTIVLEEDRHARRSSRWRVHGIRYMYELTDGRINEEKLAFHWHPNGEEWLPAFAHLHVKSVPGLLGMAHIPGPCIVVHELVRFLIEQLHVAPRHGSWPATLNDVAKQAAADSAWVCGAPPM